MKWGQIANLSVLLAYAGAQHSYKIDESTLSLTFDVLFVTR